MVTLLLMLRHNGQRLFSLEKPFDDDRALSSCSTRWNESISLAAVAIGEGGISANTRNRA
jgi:hypothetical protein